MIEKYLLACYILWSLVLVVSGMPAWIGVPVLIAVMIWCKQIVSEPVVHWFTFTVRLINDK